MDTDYLIKVTMVKYVGDYKMHLKFSTGEEKIVDMKPYLRGEMFVPLKNKRIFEQLKLSEELGTVVWPNGADWAPYDLYDIGKPVKVLSAL